MNDAANSPSAPTSRIDAAARLLLELRGGQTPRPGALPTGCSPSNHDEAHAIQLRQAALLDDPVGGWKIGPSQDGTVLRGALLTSRIAPSPARLPPMDRPFQGVEPEIAFRFDTTLPANPDGYSYDQVAAAVTAMPVIEVVESRFASYADAPFIDRLADFMSNGWLICGTPRPDWRDFDLSGLEMTLSIDGQEIVRGVGGHPTVDPLLPAVALVNKMARTGPMPKGTIMTTGTYCPIQPIRPGARLRINFSGFGQVEADFAE